MPKFVIEREMLGVGGSSPDQLREAARDSNTVVRELGGGIQWVTSYVTDDKLYCIYIAQDEDIIREHASCLDIPANRISRVMTNIDPSTEEAPMAVT